MNEPCVLRQLIPLNLKIFSGTDNFIRFNDFNRQLPTAECLEEEWM